MKKKKKNDIPWEYTNYLSHHGILGMRWGVRRYQNEDGTLTPEGRKRIADRYKQVKEDNFKTSAYIKIGLKKTKGQYTPEELKKLTMASIRYHRNSDYAATMERYFRESKTNISLKEANEYSDLVAKRMFEQYGTPISDVDSPMMFRRAVQQLWDELDK